MRIPRHTLSILAFVAMAVGASRASAADHPALLPYLSSDVEDVGYLDLSKVDVPAALDEVLGWVDVPQDEQARAKAKAAAAQAVIKELTDRGVRRIYIPFRMSDIREGGPAVVIEMAPGGDSKAVINMLTGMLAGQGGPEKDQPRAPSLFELVDGAVLGAVSSQQLQTLKASRVSKPRQEAVDALAGLVGDAGVAVFGNPESRRVVREMIPSMPPPFAEIDGRMLTDGVQWAAVALKLPPKPILTVTVNAADAATTATLDQAVDKCLALLKALCMAEMIAPAPNHHQRDAGLVLPLVPFLKPKVEGNRLTITVGDDEEEVKFLRWAVPTALKGEREKSALMQRMNNFRQISLGMLNYEAAKHSLPAASSYSADGRPLLSWRVHILPYVEQQALYEEFHLDEPWDSEHNSKLIARMPKLYADGDPAVRSAAGDGRTTYLVPTGEAMVFSGREGVKLSAIKDGTSNTIALVNVVPERAVVWTKPDDWEVDRKDPLRGVKPTAGGFTAAFCDGHVELIDGGVDPTEFGKKLTRAANEPVAP